MLMLSRERPASVAVAIGGKAVIHVRPCTSIEFYRARTAVTALMAAILSGTDAISAVADLLGTEFVAGDYSDMGQFTALSERLILIKLVVACSDGWEGVGDQDGTPLALDEANLALLLRDPIIAEKIAAIVNRRIHAEAAEGNGSPTSLNGAAVAGGNTAPNVSPATSPAPAANADSPGSAARKSNTPH